MLRKQLYLEERQDAALKARAQELGVSEAELVREALDRFLNEPDSSNSKGTASIRLRWMAELDAELDAAARETKSSEGYRFRRDDAYDDPRYT